MGTREQIWLIYKATGKCGKGYVGITTMTMKQRQRSHKGAARHGDKSPFWDAMRKYGYDHFTWEVLTECYSSKEAIMCERAMIAVHDTFYTRNGWNRNTGGGGNIHGHMSEETRKRVSDGVKERNRKNPEYKNLGSIAYTAMGRPVSPEGHQRKLAGLRTAHTPENWEKGAAKRRGVKQSEGHAKKSADAAERGRAVFKHQVWCKKEYEKALAARCDRSALKRIRKAPVISDEERQRRADNARAVGYMNKNKPSKLRGTKRPPFSEETKAKMSASQKRRFSAEKIGYTYVE